MKSIVLFLGCLLPAATHLSGQTNDQWGAYEPRTLKSIVASHKADLNSLNGGSAKKSSLYLSTNSFRTKTELVYLGMSRPLPANKVQLLTAWRRMLKEQAPPANLFTTELAFKEDAEHYWIAVQRPLLADFQKEVKKGDGIQGYIILIGAVRVGKRWEWLFAMNRFDS